MMMHTFKHNSLTFHHPSSRIALKRQKYIFKKGMAMIESVIILPIIMACVMLLWGQYKFFQTYLLTIEGAHQGAWQALDLRDSRGDHQTHSNLHDITSNIVSFDPAHITASANLDQKSIDVMDMPLVGEIVAFMNFFDLNPRGKWECSIESRIKPYENNVMDHLFNLIQQNPGEDAEFTFNISETILTDGWDARDPGGSTSGQVADRVQGGWLGIAGAFAGISDFLGDILSAIGIDHPRVNLSEVPPPS